MKGLVDGEGHVHLGHKGIRALAPFAKGPWRWALPLVPSWGYFGAPRDTCGGEAIRARCRDCVTAVPKPP